MTVGRKKITEQDIQNAIADLTRQTADIMAGAKKSAIIGIRQHGVTLAQRIREQLREEYGRETEMGILDITLYRDDVGRIADHPIVQSTELDFDMDDRRIILVDDVLYTGRTIRCALDQIMDYGRPESVRLVVLVDRGLRELPIQPDLAGFTIDTLSDERVTVEFAEVEGADKIAMETIEKA